MTLDQVKFLKDAYYTIADDGNTLADSVVITNDDQHIYDTSKGFVLWDDGNEFVHCVQVNNDHYNQVQAPYQISTAAYEKILYMEGRFSVKNFEKALDAICGSCMSNDQKNHIMNWARTIRNANIAPLDHRPYFQKDVSIAGQNHVPLVREDLANDAKVKEAGGFDN